MSQSIGSSIGYSRKRLKRLKRPSLGLKRPILITRTSEYHGLRGIMDPGVSQTRELPRTPGYHGPWSITYPGVSWTLGYHGPRGII